MKPEIETTDDVERRTHTVEMRVKDAAYGKKAPTMEGYAANFNQLSENLGGFREILLPGCFKNALANSDVRALFNHNPDKILGRTSAGTCRIVEDERGLRFEIDPDLEISYAKDLSRSMGRGDINQCSFGFKIAENGDSWAKDTDDLWIRSISNVERLFDVSPVTYPAYTSTSCAVRSMLQKEADLETEKSKAEAHEAEQRRLFESESLELELILAEVE